ncbi:hypothetical protein L6164_026671 [Bauhinia variegata]|uniref:Uncharacterized protein n=1 Tax=Bauhinia variegata TaxID=167791 RepID=A0ACB9LSD0_BAUVA|nr:hypothetical protein L6164_026671 [Bauhinia variegata]
MAHIFAEYIGATNPQIDFAKVPNRQVCPFHFNLAFATDYDAGGNNTNGNFDSKWAAKFDAPSISLYKKSHKETRFFLSIGWYDDKYPFTMGDNTWADNASKTLADMIDSLNIDGLDIHYSKVDASIPPDAFAHAVGNLIKDLKEKQVIQFASITPTPTLDDYYNKLYDDHKDIIDFVNYRFYDLDVTPATVVDLKKAIKDVKTKYQSAKLLVGNKTNDNSKGKILDDVFFKTYIQMSFQLHGIFAWSADESPNTFQFENDAQEELKKIK